MMNALDKVVNDEDISCKECNDTVVSAHMNNDLDFQ